MSTESWELQYSRRRGLVVGSFRLNFRVELIACVLASLVTASPAVAAIVVDTPSSTNVFAPPANQISWSHTVNSGNARVLIVGASFRRQGTAVVTSVFYGSQPLTFISGGSSTDMNSKYRAELWYLVAPNVGMNTITVNFSGALDSAVGGAVSYFGVNQAAPVGTGAGTGGITGPPTVVVSSATGELVVDCVAVKGNNNNSISVGPGQTQRWNNRTGNNLNTHTIGGGSTEPGAASVTMSWTVVSNEQWAIAAAPLRPAPEPPNILSVKSQLTYSDPFNLQTNPKAIPGATMGYTLVTTNTGLGAADADSLNVMDPIPVNTALFVGNIGLPGSGPIVFANGATPSGLSYTFTSLASTTDDVEFSNNGGTTYTYVPVPDGAGFDPNVTHLRVRPKGAFAASNGTNHPSFSLQLRVRVN